MASREQEERNERARQSILDDFSTHFRRPTEDEIEDLRHHRYERFKTSLPDEQRELPGPAAGRHKFRPADRDR
jgi:hypothetical protein